MKQVKIVIHNVNCAPGNRIDCNLPYGKVSNSCSPTGAETVCVSKTQRSLDRKRLTICRQERLFSEDS